MRFCPDCGSQRQETDKFCSECGARLTGQSAQSAPRPPASEIAEVVFVVVDKGGLFRSETGKFVLRGSDGTIHAETETFKTLLNDLRMVDINGNARPIIDRNENEARAFNQMMQAIAEGGWEQTPVMRDDPWYKARVRRLRR